MKHNVGARIRKIRQSKDLSQDNVADELGINKSSYSKIENGHTDPSLSRILKIAEILETDIREFFTDTKEVKEPAEKDKYGFASKIELIELARMIETLNDEIKAIKALLDKKE